MNTSSLNAMENELNAAATNKEYAPLKGITSEQLAQLTKLGEKVGSFKPYDTQLEIPEISGLRTVKLLYRFKDESKRNKANSYVRVPKHITEHSINNRLDDLMPYFVAYLESIEDGMIKELHSRGQLNVYPESLTLDSIIEKLEESNSGGRLTKADITAWFDSNLSDSLTRAFAEKLGMEIPETDEEFEMLDENAIEKLAKIERVVIAYKTKLESLASPSVSFNEADQQAMLALFAKIPDIEENSIARRLKSRIEGMNKKAEDLLLSL